MTTKSPHRFVGRLLPSPQAAAALAIAATTGACATSAGTLTAPASYRSGDVVDTLDVSSPVDSPAPAGVSSGTGVSPEAGASSDADRGAFAGHAMPAADRRSTTAASGAAATDAVSHDELARLFDEGEAAYRVRRYDEALAAFQRVVSLDPAQTQAWLRLGNLHHRRGKWFEALSAYRRVAARSSGDGVDAAVRAKALYNLALINLELARQSLRQLERIGPAAAAAGEREPLSAAVHSAWQRLDGFGEAAPTPRPEARSAPQSAAPRPSAGRPEAGRPGAARSGAGAQAELPRIDYFRGAPRQ
jgi:hypothetical protein